MNFCVLWDLLRKVNALKRAETRQDQVIDGGRITDSTYPLTTSSTHPTSSAAPSLLSYNTLGERRRFPNRSQATCEGDAGASD